MASIKLKGDTSGEITIQAPSVAGTNTLNLQASSGTLATTAQASVGTKNLIINGDMRIAQRETSATSLSSNGYFTVDRWKAIHGVGLGVWTNEQSTDVPSGQGFSHSFKSTCTTADASPAAGDIVQVIQEIEGQNMVSLKKGTANAESATLSFWVKSNVTGTYTIEWRDSDNNRHICASYSITASDTWEKKTITFAGDTVSAFVYDNSTCGNIGFCYGAGSNFTSGTLATSWASRNIANLGVGQVNVGASTNNYFQLTGVQLEVGTEATPFENRMYSTELAMCQRYYQKLTPLSGNYSPFGIARGDGGTGLLAYLKYAATVRAAPTITVTGTAVNTPSQIAVTAIGNIYSGTDAASVSLTSASSVASGACAIWLANVNTTDNIQISAEL